MEPVPKLSREAYIGAMRAKCEELLGRVADAVNDARPGQVIQRWANMVGDHKPGAHDGCRWRGHR